MLCWRSVAAAGARGRLAHAVPARDQWDPARARRVLDALSGKLELHRAVRRPRAVGNRPRARRHARHRRRARRRGRPPQQRGFTAEAIWAMRSQVAPTTRRRRARRGVATSSRFDLDGRELPQRCGVRATAAPQPRWRPRRRALARRRRPGRWRATGAAPRLGRRRRAFPRGSRSRTTWHTSGSPRDRPSRRRAVPGLRAAAQRPTPRLPPSTSRAAGSSGARRCR